MSTTTTFLCLTIWRSVNGPPLSYNLQTDINNQSKKRAQNTVGRDPTSVGVT